MKRGIYALCLLLSLPLVSAQGTITEGFQFLFGQSSNEIVLKIGLMIVLIALFKASLLKMGLFDDHPNTAVLIAVIISLIAVKFMPIGVSSTLGALIWVMALFALPYTLIGMFIKSKFWKFLFTFLGVFGIYYFVTGGGFGFYGSRYPHLGGVGGGLGTNTYPYFGFIRGHEVFDDIYYYLTLNKWLVPILFIVFLLVYFFHKGKLPMLNRGGGGERPEGFFSKWRKRALLRKQKNQEIKSEREQQKEETKRSQEETKRTKWTYKQRAKEAARERKEEKKREKEERAQEKKVLRRQRRRWFGRKLWDGTKASAQGIKDAVTSDTAKQMGMGVVKGVGKGAQAIGKGVKSVATSEPVKKHAKSFWGQVKTIFGKKESSGKEYVKPQIESTESFKAKKESLKRERPRGPPKAPSVVARAGGKDGKVKVRKK